jgi:hypothetical protein
VTLPDQHRRARGTGLCGYLREAFCEKCGWFSPDFGQPCAAILPSGSPCNEGPDWMLHVGHVYTPSAIGSGVAGPPVAASDRVAEEGSAQ